jgi:undecaprenyl phosphate-alpha-L-ara4N flippase subunit ArnE
MVVSYLFLAAAILLGVAGQIVLKAGANTSASTWTQFLSPFTIGGLAIYVIASVPYIVALKRLPISQAFPSVAASYAVVAIIAHFLWNEPFGWPQFGGLVLIGAGIVLIHQG